MTYTQAQIDRAARLLADSDSWNWEALPVSVQTEYMYLATEVARELDGGE